MRILGFSNKWPKLEEPEFTTFRLTRRDKDWQEEETVQIVYRPRSKDRELLGPALIVKIESRRLLSNLTNYGLQYISNYEAIQDGFDSLHEMEIWLFKAHGDRVLEEPINKLTLRHCV